MPEPEMYFGAAAGLAAFLFHSFAEFVWQLVATAGLAAVFAGFLSGSLPVEAAAARPERRIWRAGLVMGGLILAVALCQGIAATRWNAALARKPVAAFATMERCLAWWPFDAERWVTLIRLEAREARSKGRLRGTGTPEYARLRSLFGRALAREPYNSQLRIELARFDISCGADPVLAKREARDAVRIDRLRPSVSLMFAEAYAEGDPDFALELLRNAPLETREDLRRAYDAVWRANPDAALLWSLTPPTVTGWLALGDFAVEKDLTPMAVDAYMKAAGFAPWRELYRRYMNAGEFKLALQTVGNRKGSADANVARGRAYRRLGEYAAANQAFSLVWLQSQLAPALTESRQIADRSVTVERMYRGLPKTLREAERIAEAFRLEARSPRKAEALLRLHDLFPESFRIHWLAFEAAASVTSIDAVVNAKWLERSSELAETLADRVVAKVGNRSADELVELDNAAPRPAP
jgi:tetratricopeptide (TPR) repeat protein